MSNNSKNNFSLGKVPFETTIHGKRRNKNKLDSNSLPDYGVEEWRDGAVEGINISNGSIISHNSAEF
ncbi:hypothetical protein FF38_13380 [Lucilia cuprina]|uniref:Uncharacterized protein n=1 Tax=Lucilia cuprina TaxID=7375 RepID=A0A0L0BW60_LUCCU|nr:hypothetical protein FF38_13380 [Lucilia cuprina]